MNKNIENHETSQGGVYDFIAKPKKTSIENHGKSWEIIEHHGKNIKNHEINSENRESKQKCFT